MGNILSNTSSVTGDTQVENYLYQTATSTRPHAISTATINGISYSFTYDANGAITVYDAAGTNPDKFIAYNAANQPTKITVGTSLNDANPIARDEFRYTPDGARYYKKTTYKESTRLRTEYTLYIGDYETTYFDTFSALKQSEKSQVGSAILNIRKTPYSGLITDDVEVLHRDHLGSVDAVTVSTATVANLAFEPFGARRSSTLLTNATTTEMTNILAKTDVLNSKGYTGHESLDRTGLIHMNGRVYDPQLGRFLSPDPLVQSPTNSQSWNRYSYVFNNPLKYTDPSGFAGLGCAGGTFTQEGYADKHFANTCGSDSQQVDKSILDGNRAGGSDERSGVPNSNTSSSQISQQGGQQYYPLLEGKNDNSIAGALIITASGVATGAEGASGIELALGNPWALAVLGILPTKIGDGTLSGSNSKKENSKLMFHYSPFAVLKGPLRPGSFLTPFYGYTSAQAVQKLALDVSKANVQLYIHSFRVSAGQYTANPDSIPGTNIVAPLNGQPGGGIEFITTVPLNPIGPSVPAPQ